MRNKGFTLVELVVACTLLLMLSTIATTSTFNFVQATGNLKAQYNNIQNIMLLHKALVQAKMNYATDLALESTNTNETKANPDTNPNCIAFSSFLITNNALPLFPICKRASTASHNLQALIILAAKGR